MNKSLLFIPLLMLAGCKEEPVVTYRVPKEEFNPLHAERLPALGKKEIEWKTPAGWKEQAPSAMRVGSFLVRGENGQVADISIVSLSGDAGGDLANVNRWRGQINLPPLSEAELNRESGSVTIAGHRGRLIDFTSKENLIDGKMKKRLIAAFHGHGDKTWFFKMTGEDGLVAKIKPDFVKFLANVKINDGHH